MREFNINDRVLVKLTHHGRTYHRRRHAELYPGLRYHAPYENAEGWSGWQFWALMQDFGGAISMGGPLPFETDIRLDPSLTQEGDQ